MSARPVIIGGGPAGSACAIELLRRGAAPLVIERNRGAGDALCGGLLSWRTLARLEALGLSETELGGHPVTQLRIFAGGAERAAALPARAMGLSRGRLDRLMLTQAERLGAEVVHAAARLDDAGVVIDGATPISADCIFLATGKHDLRGLPRPKPGAADDPVLGLRWRLSPDRQLAEQLGHTIELHLFAGGYAGLVLHETGMANLCMAVRRSVLSRAGGSPRELLAELARKNPALAARLDSSDVPEAFDAIANVPYGWRAAQGTSGLFRLGDQAGVIPSLAGEGVGLALASAQAAVRHWHEGGAGAAVAFQPAFARTLRRPLASAGCIARFADHRLSARMLTHLAGVPAAVRLVAHATRV